MYRITKVLNHNTIMGIKEGTTCEYLLMGKGIGFGKKVSEHIETDGSETLYSLQESTERGNAKELALSVEPICLELAGDLLDEAEKEFQKIDRNIIFPLADHLAFAIERMKKGEAIYNPLTEDIRILFYKEFKVAQRLQPVVKESLGIEIDDNEVGYVALHIHSAIQDENVSQAMQMARAVRECITVVEEEIGKPIDVLTLSYNRLMNHVRNMVARVIHHEELKLNMNDYMSIKFPKSFATAEVICRRIEEMLKCKLGDVEIGYLAMHIERVTTDETENE